MKGHELRARREAMNLSQAELARRLGVSPQTVYKWETERVKIERAVMMDLALKQLAQEMMQALRGGEREAARDG